MLKIKERKKISSFILFPVVLERNCLQKGVKINNKNGKKRIKERKKRIRTKEKGEKKKRKKTPPHSPSVTTII